ncbi:MAG: Single-stranded DNA-binding protein [Candidatus Pacebacteria bacterium GW2011_GWB1_47_8]|nr:MAG: Single-stranded DNA-binding protein [Candidatus Pacebacteria bacterium GW2011_GWA1_46_10]KKU84693.1 MAG: Single-stranded DNA-binding protein [Candidatus Pacebacteria bacterium GW2011_GWB1_47_8]HCR80860.1 single-stranded DNA-binding protein [Candidatus Paceibacterota bacterium]
MAARSLNKAMLIGNLTRDPNLRFTPNGTAVCSFGIATNRSWTSADGGEKQERVDFHNIVAWAKLAEICGQLLHKGDKVFVEGRIQTRDWKTEQGDDRRITEIVIDNMMLLSSRGNGAPVSDLPADDSAGVSSTDDTATDDSKKGKGKKRGKKAEVKEELPADEAVESVEDVSDDIPF